MPLAALLLALVAAGCAAGTALSRGRAAERVNDYDRAVVEYTKALKDHPDDLDARLALDRAKVRAADVHFTRGRRMYATGRLEEALVELQLASELSPGNGAIDDELRRTRVALRTKIAVPADGKTRLETLVERSREMQPAGLDLPRDLKLPPSMVFREAGVRDVLTAMARFANVNVAFDPAFRDAAITIELRDTEFEAGLASVTASTRNFYKVTAPRTITIVPDTPAKRREYEDEVVRTFYLSNAELKETIDLLRIVVDLRRLAGVPGTNAITIKDTPERLAAAGKIIAAIDKARPEVVIDVELLEVDRRRFREYGLQFASPNTAGATGIDGAADVNQEGLTLDSLRRLTQADVFLTGVPALYYKLLKSDTNTRTLASPQLRTAEGITAQAKFGERVPVPVTTFSPIATGGVPQQPVTSFNYENIGVNIDITPRMHHNDDVSLALKVEVSSVSGAGFGGLPTFGNRFINTVIRLKDGETNMLAGLIRDDERRVLDGVPGLSDLPIVGRLFSRNRRETQETDIILTLTPHIVRVLDLSEADLRPFRLRREGGAASAIDIPTTPAQVPLMPDEGAQPAPLRPGQRPAMPITPPDPTPPPQPPPPPQ